MEKRYFSRKHAMLMFPVEMCHEAMNLVTPKINRSRPLAIVLATLQQ